MLFDYLVVAISLKLASVDQKAFGFFFEEKNPVWPKYQKHPLNRYKYIPFETREIAKGCISGRFKVIGRWDTPKYQDYSWYKSKIIGINLV